MSPVSVGVTAHAEGRAAVRLTKGGEGVDYDWITIGDVNNQVVLVLGEQARLSLLNAVRSLRPVSYNRPFKGEKV